jgi:hypothetical protein
MFLEKNKEIKNEEKQSFYQIIEKCLILLNKVISWNFSSIKNVEYLQKEQEQQNEQEINVNTKKKFTDKKFFEIISKV